ncbi:response regulator [Paenibacillus sp. CC-CFT747]|nr:response regulator [Paenibacillus sp. CC-CFT747]
MENAIKHGIEEKPGKGIIRIGCRAEDETLLLEVSDNGIGMDDQTIDQVMNPEKYPGQPVKDKHTRVGIISVHKRVGILYGSGYGLTIRSVPGSSLSYRSGCLSYGRKSEMKKKVIVIDDKPLIVRSIVQTIDWERLGCEVIGQAEDGEEGERLILDMQPDILITDIRMPGHDGLYLSELMHSRFPRSKTILITGYQEFEYAQRAVRLGAFDLIVKPLRNDELYRVVEAAVREIEATRSEKQAVEQLSRDYNDLEQLHTSSLPALRSKWMTDLIRGKVEEADLPAAQRELGIQYSRFSLIAIKPYSNGGEESLTSAHRERIVQTVMAAPEKEELQIIDTVWNDELLFVCLFPRIPTTREARMKLQTIASDWLERIRCLNGERCHIAIGHLRKSLKELGEAYSEVKALLESGFFRGRRRSYFTKRIPFPGSPANSPSCMTWRTSTGCSSSRPARK